MSHHVTLRPVHREHTFLLPVVGSIGTGQGASDSTHSDTLRGILLMERGPMAVANKGHGKEHCAWKEGDWGTCEQS